MGKRIIVTVVGLACLISVPTVAYSVSPKRAKRTYGLVHREGKTPKASRHPERAMIAQQSYARAWKLRRWRRWGRRTAKAAARKVRFCDLRGDEPVDCGEVVRGAVKLTDRARRRCPFPNGKRKRVWLYKTTEISERKVEAGQVPNVLRLTLETTSGKPPCPTARSLKHPA